VKLSINDSVINYTLSYRMFSDCVLLFSSSPPPVWVRSTAIGLSVCLSLAYLNPHTCKYFKKFSVRVTCAVARSFSDNSAMRYVLSVLRMTLCLHIMGLVEPSRITALYFVQVAAPRAKSLSTIAGLLLLQRSP